MGTQDELRQLFESRFSETALPAARRAALRGYLRDTIGSVDAAGESITDPARQRDLAIKFHWGHHHRFAADLQVEGMMQDRHLSLIASFIDEFGLPRDLTGKTVLDIGCWTGGTSLMLAAMGARVFALEEVRKYADTVNFLAGLFDLSSRLLCFPESLYSVLPRYADYFDLILYAGVIYHVSDPVLSLRRMFSALRDGGICYVESTCLDAEESVAAYRGSNYFWGGATSELNRRGWDYFVPSRLCLENWCRDAGFEEVRLGPRREGRVAGTARRKEFADFLRSGISRPDCR